MNILDENIPANQRQLLEHWRIKVHQIGFNIGRRVSRGGLAVWRRSCSQAGITRMESLRLNGAMSDVTEILSRIDSGDCHAAEQLLPLVYQELRKLAAARLAQEKPGQTLQPTALVHEAWLRLVGSERPHPGPLPEGEGVGQQWDSRRHFFGAAAEAMRRILVENARRKARHRHGGGRLRVEFPEDVSGAATQPEEILAVHEALDELARVDGQAAQLVKLHYFAGLGIEEAALLLNISPRTAYRNWSFARAWLFRHLQPAE